MSEALDKLVLELRALKATHGDPSFAELAKLVASVRQARGDDLAKAKVATSTLNDAFRTGRSRLNPALLRDIVIALTGDVQMGEEWAERCGLANAKLGIVGENTTTDPDIEPMVPAQYDEPAEQPATNLVQVITAKPVTNPITARSVPFLSLLVLGGVAVDFLIPLVVNAIYRGYQPLFLDMIGTAIVAMAGGPWLGALTGLLSTSASALLAGPAHLAFALVKIAGALVWGYGLRRFKLGDTFPKYLLLNVIVALICSIISVSLIMVLFDNDLRHPLAGTLAEIISSPFHQSTQTINLGGGGYSLALLLTVNLLLSLIDKVLTGIITLLAFATCLKQWSPINWLRTE